MRSRGILPGGLLAFSCGWLALVVALLSPLDEWSETLFVAHMAQHELLMVVAAPLIALSSPLAVLLPGRAWSVELRVLSSAEAAALRDWRPNVALVDGTLLTGSTRMHIGSPTLVLSGTESDGRALLRRLPEGRGWLRKDATAAEFVKMIDGVAIAPNTRRVLGTLGFAVRAKEGATAQPILQILACCSCGVSSCGQAMQRCKHRIAHLRRRHCYFAGFRKVGRALVLEREFDRLV